MYSAVVPFDRDFVQTSCCVLFSGVEVLALDRMDNCVHASICCVVEETGTRLEVRREILDDRLGETPCFGLMFQGAGEMGMSVCGDT